MNNKYYGYIYLTTNLITKKMYIGQHKGKFNARYLGSGLYIKRSIKKYNRENFKVELLCTANSLEELNQLEIEYINKYNSIDVNIGYNIALGGSGSPGVPVSESTRKIKSEISKKLWQDEEYANRVISGVRNYWEDENNHIKFSELNSGENNPMYGKRGKDASCFGRTGEKHPMYGKHHTEETKKKISEASKQMFIDRPELKEILSNKHSGVNNYRAISVVCLTKDNLTFVRVYEYVSEVDKHGFHHSAVCSCCKYKLRTHKNFVWLYKDVYDSIKKDDGSIDRNVWKELYNK